jgi:hypothetical protein
MRIPRTCEKTPGGSRNLFSPIVEISLRRRGVHRPAADRSATRFGVEGSWTPGTKKISAATWSERCAGLSHRLPPDCSGRRRPRPAHLSLCSYPLGVPPCENPFPFIGLSLGRPPPNDPHREAAVLMVRTLLTRCRSQGSVCVAVRLHRLFLASGPPESQRGPVTPAGRRLHGRQRDIGSSGGGAGQRRSDLRQGGCPLGIDAGGGWRPGDLHRRH